jgi:hypothetical protein
MGRGSRKRRTPDGGSVVSLAVPRDVLAAHFNPSYRIVMPRWSAGHVCHQTASMIHGLPHPA